MNISDNIRVRRPSEHDQLLDKLVKEDKIFTSLKNAMVFAASVGFNQQLRLPFEKSSEPIRISIFDKETDIPFILTLGLSETNNIEYMKENRFTECVKIFEEYSNGGLSQIASNYDSIGGLQSLERLIIESKQAEDVSEIFGEWDD